jgi:membrane associated rhomboid family serine protease
MDDKQVMNAAQASAQMAGQSQHSFGNVNHIAHLSGALVGVLLIWLISRIAPHEKLISDHSKQEKATHRKNST